MIYSQLRQSAISIRFGCFPKIIQGLVDSFSEINQNRKTILSCLMIVYE